MSFLLPSFSYNLSCRDETRRGGCLCYRPQISWWDSLSLTSTDTFANKPLWRHRQQLVSGFALSVAAGLFSFVPAGVMRGCFRVFFRRVTAFHMNNAQKKFGSQSWSNCSVIVLFFPLLLLLFSLFISIYLLWCFIIDCIYLWRFPLIKFILHSFIINDYFLLVIVIFNDGDKNEMLLLLLLTTVEPLLVFVCPPPTCSSSEVWTSATALPGVSTEASQQRSGDPLVAGEQTDETEQPAAAEGTEDQRCYFGTRPSGASTVTEHTNLSLEHEQF